MRGGSSTFLDAHVTRRVHEGLTIDATVQLGDEIGVLFGTSGAGKSTLLRLLAGLSRPDSGRISLSGELLLDSARGLHVPLRRRRMGMIFQDDLLFPHLDVARNIGFGLRGASRSDCVRRTEEVAALCGVTGLLGRRVATLSGGERQRVGLARALAPRPRLLLCDEPVSALDLPGRHTLLDRFRSVQRAEGIPILYVTHSPAEAITLGTRLFLMENGRIVAEGPPAEVLSETSREAFRHLEGVRNAFAGAVAEQSQGGGWTRIDLDGGPSLIVPWTDLPIGASTTAEVDGDDVLLAVGPVAGLSARNQVQGVVEAVAAHGREAEVVIRTGDLRWFVGVLASVAGELSLAPGRPVTMIIKARSVRVECSSD
ncbi:molybdenum ABC transporter ATP-binding protein [Paludisphaera rhizosphaerae]|uniref:molybdenum ABC transporter ATP-binding protein n=1 Tax=Paludisphaera rhizosphaerae TaxID=2711216 RepID=UPI0013ED2160|nr:ATP-binding cassette domain-containing protein [Paludisphaera rhizosphaerae]